MAARNHGCSLPNHRVAAQEGEDPLYFDNGCSFFPGWAPFMEKARRIFCSLVLGVHFPIRTGVRVTCGGVWDAIARAHRTLPRGLVGASACPVYIESHTGPLTAGPIFRPECDAIHCTFATRWDLAVAIPRCPDVMAEARGGLVSEGNRDPVHCPIVQT